MIVAILVSQTAVTTRLVKRLPSLPAIIGTSAKYRQSVSEIFNRAFSEHEGCTSLLSHTFFINIVYFLFFFLPSQTLFDVTSCKVFFITQILTAKKQVGFE